MTTLNHDAMTPPRRDFGYRWILCGFLVAVLCGIFILGAHAIVADSPWKIKAGGLFLAVIGGGFFWMLVDQLLLPAPILTIDAQGIWDRRISGAPLPWRAIRRIYPQRFPLPGSLPTLRVELSDPTCYRPPSRGVWRFLPRRRGVVPSLVIVPALLNARSGEILAEIERFRPGAVTAPIDPLGAEASVRAAEAAGYQGDSQGLACHRNRKILKAHLGISLVAASVFAVMLAAGIRSFIIVALIVGGALLFALWLLRELSLSKPRLIVGPEGITLADFGSRTVSWQAVQDVKVTDQFIKVEEEVPQDAVPQGALAEFFSSRNPVIVTFALDASTDEIRAAVAHFRAQALESSSSRR
ncbi:hypothetical protein [Pelagibius sp. 7325]|uniref:hypothetical protein n=1 Tax=Pelagibius sp. 7325 TaxID=3131994 RepID=UPI0030EF7E40